MKLSTGKVAFTVEFDNGDNGIIYINPNDKELQSRIQNFEKVVKEKADQVNAEKFQSGIDKIKDLKFDLKNPESILERTPEEIEEIKEGLSEVSELTDKYNNILKEELDNVFQSDISDVAFKYCDPLDMVVVEYSKGKETRELYILHFIHWLLCELNEYNAKNQKAMQKHLAKYSK